ncbi:MAG TPA: NAD-dependent epimerase/dehydratase family protein [Flavitalea sp.]|nr:NAD-dependent epimerase/dehydratase family protein [Flavitalea sp.]
MTDRILIIGAYGQIGTELTLALKRKYGPANVIATDIRIPDHLSDEDDSCLYLDVLNRRALDLAVNKYQITQIYLLAAVLSVSGEQQPLKAWELNMQGLLNVLESARENFIARVFWPSSIAVFGHHAPKKPCPQHTVLQPSTAYGISKAAGEDWCQYYFHKFDVDVRSLRFPGLISSSALPGGGATDYAVDIFHHAVRNESYTCYLKASATLPMMYMADAVRAVLELMEAPAAQLTVHTAYNISGMSFTPTQLAASIKKRIPGFKINYKPDSRQSIAESWPTSIDDRFARKDWGWEPEYDLDSMTDQMLLNLRHSIPELQV